MESGLEPMAADTLILHPYQVTGMSSGPREGERVCSFRRSP